MRGTDKVKGGMGASNCFPSSATIWYAPRMVPTAVSRCVPLLYSKLSPGLSRGCCPTTPRPLTSTTLLLASVMTQCRLTSCAGTVPELVTVIVYAKTYWFFDGSDWSSTTRCLGDGGGSYFSLSRTTKPPR